MVMAPMAAAAMGSEAAEAASEGVVWEGASEQERRETGAEAAAGL